MKTTSYENKFHTKKYGKESNISMDAILINQCQYFTGKLTQKSKKYEKYEYVESSNNGVADTKR